MTTDTDFTLSAQKAFLDGDIGLSQELHRKKAVNHAQEAHSGDAGEYISAIVFGGLDGIVTTFAIVAAATAAHLSRGIILIVGFANLLGDAIGMGVGDYVSTKAEIDHANAERKREEWEIENCLEVEKKEMTDIYEKKGLSPEDAKEVVELLLENKNVFLDQMMIEELGIMPVDNSENPLKSGFITFGSFMVFGGLPMLAYLCAGSYTTKGNFDAVFIAAIILFAVALFSLGAVKGKITSKRWYLSGLVMLINGSITTGISYAIGYLLADVAFK